MRTFEWVVGDSRPALAGLDSAEVTRSARDLKRLQRRVSAARLAVIARFAELHDTVDDPTACADAPSVLHGERLVQIGADGTPLVAEFACLELAAALGIPVDQAQVEVQMVLDLKHRFPRLWSLVHRDKVTAWKALEVVNPTADLTLESCHQVDSRVAPIASSTRASVLREIIQATVLELLPPQLADEKRAAARERRHVTFTDTHDPNSLDQQTQLSGTLDAVDGRHLRSQVNRIATILGRAGNSETRSVREALALGVLATPARALSILQASLLDELPIDAAAKSATAPESGDRTGCPLDGEAGHTCGTITVDPDDLLPTAELVVHLTDDTLATGDGPVRVERIGPTLARWTKELLGHHRVRVRPILNLDRISPVSSYEIPDRMRAAVYELNPWEAFPWSNRASRPSGRRAYSPGRRGLRRGGGSHACDLDHTVPWPTGATSIDNLKPLSRRVHRAKTFARWRDTAVTPGVVLWTSPLGYRYLHAHGQTFDLDPPPARSSITPRRTANETNVSNRKRSIKLVRPVKQGRPPTVRPRARPGSRVPRRRASSATSPSPS